MDKISRIKELVEILNKASKAYYAEDVEIMSNQEYDSLYDELVKEYCAAGLDEIHAEKARVYDAEN